MLDTLVLLLISSIYDNSVATKQLRWWRCAPGTPIFCSVELLGRRNVRWWIKPMTDGLLSVWSEAWVVWPCSSHSFFVFFFQFIEFHIVHLCIYVCVAIVYTTTLAPSSFLHPLRLRILVLITIALIYRWTLARSCIFFLRNARSCNPLWINDIHWHTHTLPNELLPSLTVSCPCWYLGTRTSALVSKENYGSFTHATYLENSKRFII